MEAVGAQLETSRLRLRPVLRAEANRLLTQDTLGVAWAPGFGPLEIPAQPLIDSLDKLAGLHLFLTRDPEEVVGYSRFEAGRSTPHTIWIYYGVAEQRRRRGFATEGVGAQVNWLARQLNIEWVKADVHRSNEASKGVLRALGFTRGPDAIQEVWCLEAK